MNQIKITLIYEKYLDCKILISLSSLEEQQKIVERIEKEQALINANKEIIKIFDEKIRNIIQKVWD